MVRIRTISVIGKKPFKTSCKDDFKYVIIFDPVCTSATPICLFTMQLSLGYDDD